MSYQIAEPAPPVPAASVRYVDWAPIFAGAIGASAVSFVLLSFGAAVGLSMTSAWPNVGFSAAVAGVVVAVWTVLVQIAAFAGGGYLAGRMRVGWAEAGSDEAQFRDAAHGFLVWAVGVLIGVALLALAAGAGVRVAGQAVSGGAGGVAANPSVASSMAPESSPYRAALDVMLRPTLPANGQGSIGGTAGQSAGQGAGQGAGRDDSAFRTEAGRILTDVIRNRELTAADRSYLAAQISQRYGVPQPEAEKRVDAAVQSAREAEAQVRAAADKTRRGAVLAGFLTAASLLISCAAAVAAAAMGGRDRDTNTRFLFAGRRFW